MILIFNNQDFWLFLGIHSKKTLIVVRTPAKGKDMKIIIKNLYQGKGKNARATPKKAARSMSSCQAAFFEWICRIFKG